MRIACLALGLLVIGGPGFAQQQIHIDTFEKVWTTIRDQHWEVKPGGLEWDVIHHEFRPRIERAKDAEAARAIIREMLGRLHQTHFTVVPAAAYVNGDNGGSGGGWPGFEVRVLEGRVIVVEAVEKSPVRPGAEIVSVNGVKLAPLAARLAADPAISGLTLQRTITERLTGPVGTSKQIEILDGAGAVSTVEVTLTEPRGNLAGFGSLPPQHVWFEAKRLGNTGYLRFNEFLDLVRMMGQFGQAIEECIKCDGLVIDLRGNLGGIDAMAMGMAGFLTDKPDLRLGTMYMRGTTLNFVINPRAGAYTGPLAILVDGLSASTSEIFAGGLQDIGRARVFGTRTAGAALPSVFTRLPNGDGFQYAVANYISEGGRTLEGNGVTPDVEVRLTRDGLLAGRDAVLEAALDWIRRAKQ